MLTAGQPAGKLSLLTLLLVWLALLASSADGQYDGSGDKESESTHPTGEGDTLTDDEDFTGKVPVTLFATTSLSCMVWKETDRLSGSQTIINKMIVYVAGVCECDFDSTYLSSFTSNCDPHAGTLLVSTNLSLPFNHQRSQLVGYLENWIKTEPQFTKTLGRGARATVNIVNLETSISTYLPTPEGSGGDEEDKSRGEETPSVVGEQEREDREEGSGSGSSGDILGDSTLPVATDIGTLLLSCVTGLAVCLLMNYS